MQEQGFCLSCFLLLFLFTYETKVCPSSIQFDCPDHTYDTGKTQLSFPFTNSTVPNCGRCVLICNEHNRTEINCMGTLDANYLLVLDIIPSNHTIVASFPKGLDLDAIKKDICIDPKFDPTSQSVSFVFVDGFETYIRCPYTKGALKWDNKHYQFCGYDYNLYGPYENGKLPSNNPLPNGCLSIKISKMAPNNTKFSAQYTFSGDCERCLARGGRCHDSSDGKVDCDNKKGKRRLKIILLSSGEGGFGGVYKGKLLDGRLVAVKILKKSKGDGEGFMNEVISIGRTNHVNVVTLLGFCFEGHKRALVYEYMPNGSLDKFRHGGASNGVSLPLETMFRIMLGIARGLEYLHRGCKTRILHFDIKPHNILLDEEFCPKISDFGLSKLAPQDKISMSRAKGTFEYIAPEVFCRNFGDVSNKSDVYSYCMMVLETIRSRNRGNSEVECSSDVYFPKWIYKSLSMKRKQKPESLLPTTMISN